MQRLNLVDFRVGGFQLVGRDFLVAPAAHVAGAPVILRLDREVQTAFGLIHFRVVLGRPSGDGRALPVHRLLEGLCTADEEEKRRGKNQDSYRANDNAYDRTSSESMRCCGGGSGAR